MLQDFWGREKIEKEALIKQIIMHFQALLLQILAGVCHLFLYIQRSAGLDSTIHSCMEYSQNNSVLAMANKRDKSGRLY